MVNVGQYIRDDDISPMLLSGDCLEILRVFPDNCIDCIMTSPPYWGHRHYENGGIGLEAQYSDFIANLLSVTAELKRVLKPMGSFWLNIGDTYRQKSLQAIPWRIAIAMMDEQQWILRNSVVWNKHKGGLDSSKDKLRNIYENVFHFVQHPKYYYDASAIRRDSRKSTVKNGAVVSATGVTGVRYKRQIELSTVLTEKEKKRALQELLVVLDKIKNGEVSDFRMIIRGQQRATHSESTTVSGRAKELQEKGYYFLFYHPDGTMPSDIWDITPEDSQNRKLHYAVYPEDLCKIPILSTCPQGGIVLDPFCGSGTTMLVAYKMKRKSIGIDLSHDYLAIAQERIIAYEEQNSRTLQLFNE